MPRILVIILLLSQFTLARATVPDHHIWSNLLQDHVILADGGHSSTVDYRGMQADRQQLVRYLAQLAEVDRNTFDGWEEADQLAFLINAYNAATIQLVLAEYPGLDSIRDIGWLPGAPWRREFVALFGRRYSLDEIEHGMIRRDFNEPRIHFAVNCASVGCPMLREEAYTGERLEQQLEQQARRFLSDRSRNRATPGGLRLSPIFEWYRDDFSRGWRGHSSLGEFLLDYREALGLSAAQAAALRANEMDIIYLEYDWRLNDNNRR
ncbi:DUF547 domain-containing protein [Microbulbifer sp. YPW16]|uniref:DUF547 domain-containing protein n=1 Tax=Microbulbifer sp. YPW16 TaxID=2904242 RepID=UPI001E4F2C1C|nr:DUF547 domain-containing protein [Microbulbifer sp. YPW16]UHQ55720.1 DUF547 domain-containing protein [Microbulbifer sp. YPW16]